MLKSLSEIKSKERRSDPRSSNLRNYRVEIKFVGEPIYQFRVTDVSTEGAGLIIKDNSRFLKLIEVGQIIDVKFISPKNSNPTEIYKAEIRHITKIDKGRYKGHCLIGLSILESHNQPKDVAFYFIP